MGIAAHRLQGPLGIDAAHHRRRRPHGRRIPAIAVAHIHEFDQPQFHPPPAGQGRQGQQLVGIAPRAGLDHGIELQLAALGIKAGGAGVLQGRQHLGQQGFTGGGPALETSHAGHAGRRHGIEADGDPIQAGGPQGLGPGGAEQHAISGEGQAAEGAAGIARGTLAQGTQGLQQGVELGM